MVMNKNHCQSSNSLTNTFYTLLIFSICNNNGQSACDICRNQHFVECAHLLELAAQEQLSYQKLPNGTNGHHVVNGRLSQNTAVIAAEVAQ